MGSQDKEAAMAPLSDRMAEMAVAEVWVVLAEMEVLAEMGVTYGCSPPIVGY